MSSDKGLIMEGLRSMLMNREEKLTDSPNIDGFYISQDLGVSIANIYEKGKVSTVEFTQGGFRRFRIRRNDSDLNFIIVRVCSLNEAFSINGKLAGGRIPQDSIIVGRGSNESQRWVYSVRFDENITLKYKKAKIYHTGEKFPSLKNVVENQVYEEEPIFYNETDIQKDDSYGNGTVEYLTKKAKYLYNKDGDERHKILLGEISQRKNYSINDEDIKNLILRMAIYAHFKRMRDQEYSDRFSRDNFPMPK